MSQKATKRPKRRLRLSASPWQVYLLRCCDGSLYAGATVDIDRRLSAHQTGKGAAYTRSRRPVELVYAEPAGDRSAALRREAALKRLPRWAKLQLVLTTSGRSG
jgi:putative endonuclease